MRLIKQPNKWSCAAASLTMLIDHLYPPKSYWEIIGTFGHDGSVETHPGFPLGFPIAEIIDTALDSFGVALVTFMLSPGVLNQKDEEEKTLYTENYINERVAALLTDKPGLITGYYAARRYHMVAWDGEQIFDPWGRVYPLDDPECIIMDQFYMAIDSKFKGIFSGIKSCSRFNNFSVDNPV